MNAPAVVVLERDAGALRPGGPQRWNATFHDEPLLRRSRDPEHDACRALLAMGITGKVTFVHKATGMAGMTMDIEKGAGRIAVEGPTGSPVIRKLTALSLSSEGEETSAPDCLPEAAE